MACGPYYPYGEDVRFSILDPATFGYRDFCGFHFSATIYYDDECTRTNEASGRAKNVLLWKDYCKNKVDTAGIYEAIYNLTENELIANSSNNTMISYLRQAKDTNAINYLRFAKQCNDFNTWIDDPWERSNEWQTANRTPLINVALQAMARVKNKAIQKRYAFLTIRLAYYNGDEKTIENIYRQYFNVSGVRKNIVDYWALYFKAITDTSQVKQNYYLALVFANAPDKRLAIAQHYNRKVPLNAVLALAKNNTERAAVCLINDLKNIGVGLTELKTVYQFQPNSQAFSFLLLREMNKLEDWIYTPYYTYFLPSIKSLDTYFNYEKEISDESKFALAHIDKDRQYAQKLLQFLETVNLAKVENTELVKTVKAYLQLMTNQYSACLGTIKTISSKALPAQLIKALCTVSMQSVSGCKIPGQFKKLIMEQGESKNYNFLFAIARELEYKGNTTEAALLYSKLNHGEYADHNMYWRTKKNHNTLLLDFYDNYFFYLDAEYTPVQTKALIAAIEKSRTGNKSSFEKWAYSDVNGDIGRLYDLLGTKYMRLNKLNDAYKAFEKVDDSVWNEPGFYYKDFLNANAFYTNFYTEHQQTKADTVRFTKTTLTARLMDYLQKANDIQNKKRDYYYFLVANCYFNMTQYGNSWMMKRYFWTSYPGASGLEDDKEYFQANLAKEYYLKAKAVAKTPQFAALCLRMAGRCEKYRQRDLADLRHTANSSGDELTMEDNRYYNEIKTKYPDDFENLMSNCYSFEKYFAARQNMP
ncbi:hypothetical protein GCM10027043_41080 [Ferruginibacter profundus]